MFSTYASWASYEDADFTFEQFAKKYNFSKIAEIDETLDVRNPDNIAKKIPVDLQAYVYNKFIKLDGDIVLKESTLPVVLQHPEIKNECISDSNGLWIMD